MKNDKLQMLKGILFLLLVIGFGLAAQLFMNQRIDKNEVSLNTGWTVTAKGQLKENVDLTEINFPRLQKGDKVILERVLEESPFSQTVLRLQSNYSAVYVYLDEKEIYEYGADYLQKGQIVGNGYHWIALPENVAGKRLRIVYDTGEDKAFTSLHKIMLQDSLQVYSGLVARQMVTAVICCCLFAVGIISVFCMLLLKASDNRLRMLFWLGLFSISIAMWLFCNSRLVEGFTQNLQLICHLEYLSMYSASVDMLLFVSLFFKREKKKKLFRNIGCGFLALCMVLSGLSLTNIIHFPKTIWLFQMAMLVTAAFIIGCLFKETGRRNKAEQSFLYGLLCFFVCVILELLRYRYNKICLPVHMVQQSMIPIGAMIFILSMFGSFFYRLMERVAAEMERKTLYEMAYRDALTNIHNRAWCEKVMQEYETNKKPITILTMDLNLFKQVNDTYGHAAGDELLMRFSMLLENTFQKKGCVGRMGGDEFVVILDYQPDSQTESDLQRLEQSISQENTKERFPYEISVSYGYASDASGQQGSPWRIYEQADKQMYKNKKAGR